MFRTLTPHSNHELIERRIELILIRYITLLVVRFRILLI